MKKPLTQEQREAKQKYQREWVKKKYENDQGFREKKIAKNVAQDKAIREEVSHYKLDRGCSRCQYKRNARALQFHHKVGADKLFNISEAMQTGKKKLWIEINKCILLCANCHAEVHDET